MNLSSLEVLQQSSVLQAKRQYHGLPPGFAAAVGVDTHTGLAACAVFYRAFGLEPRGGAGSGLVVGCQFVFIGGGFAGLGCGLQLPLAPPY